MGETDNFDYRKDGAPVIDLGLTQEFDDSKEGAPGVMISTLGTTVVVRRRAFVMEY
jgi:hypothetical protein